MTVCVITACTGDPQLGGRPKAEYTLLKVEESRVSAAADDIPVTSLISVKSGVCWL